MQVAAVDVAIIERVGVRECSHFFCLKWFRAIKI